MISIVIPVYNMERTLPRAIRSVLEQEFTDWELIIVDDGSTDTSGKIAEEFASRDQRIRVLHQENLGLSSALNSGFARASGDAFLVLAADDEISPQFLSRTWAEMQKTGCDIVSTDMLSSGGVVRCRPGTLEELKSNNCHSYAALIRAELFQRSGGFNPHMNPSWEDYEFWLRCAKLGARWSHIHEGLFCYHHSASGRDSSAQGKEVLLRSKLEGFHQDLFGQGRGVVAVIIPLYQQEDFVRSAVESALKQTYPHVRVVVVNDASPKFSKRVLRGLECDVVRHSKNLGLAAARNSGLRYAHANWNAQWFICLDSDDVLDPNFVELAMGEWEDRTYIYTDVQLIGEAHHVLRLPDWDCSQLPVRHQHPCTFLAPLQMWLDVVSMRGYGYDESDVLRWGYEDLEFALACVEAGWRGKRLPLPLFQYRIHSDGSMRTRAEEHRSELVQYIRSRHPWTNSREETMARCSSCGGSAAYSAVRSSSVEVDGIPSGEPLLVTYTGVGEGVRTKVGVSGRVYRLSSRQRQVFIDSRDAHLFSSPEFRVSRVTDGEFQAAVEPDEPVEDFSRLPGIDQNSASVLRSQGFTKFTQIAELTPQELSRILPEHPAPDEVIASARILSRHLG